STSSSVVAKCSTSSRPMAHGDTRTLDFTGHQAIDSAGNGRGQRGSRRTRGGCGREVRWSQFPPDGSFLLSSQSGRVNRTHVGQGGGGPWALTGRVGIISSDGPH